MQKMSSKSLILQIDIPFFFLFGLISLPPPPILIIKDLSKHHKYYLEGDFFVSYFTTVLTSFAHKYIPRYSLQTLVRMLTGL